VLGWRGARWWRRGAGLVAVVLCVLCAALALNTGVNYLPTVTAAWQRLTGAPLPGQTDPATAAAMQRDGTPPMSSTIIAVTIPDDASGFKHRQELVYLPPTWYQSTPPPRLPVVMMIGGEFGHPADWLQAGQVQHTIEDFAAAHGGNAPVLVFVDYSGEFSNDTECVNGIRGNAADHLTKDVVPYIISHFGTSADPASWGIVGWSSGGTCALTLATMHPELFGAFVDIDGQLGPNTGTTPQTIARLFGGDASEGLNQLLQALVGPPFSESQYPSPGIASTREVGVFRSLRQNPVGAKMNVLSTVFLQENAAIGGHQDRNRI